VNCLITPGAERENRMFFGKAAEAVHDQKATGAVQADTASERMMGS
jgi:hypothetical protein